MTDKYHVKCFHIKIQTLNNTIFNIYKSTTFFLTYIYFGLLSLQLY